jgi:hypothetical protein
MYFATRILFEFNYWTIKQKNKYVIYRLGRAYRNNLITFGPGPLLRPRENIFSSTDFQPGK